MSDLTMFWWTAIGTGASVVGLVISLYLIRVTRGARDAARAARALARKRNIVEELEGASQKLQEIGNFIQQEEWMAVRIRAGEILAICRLALTRWPDHFSEGRKNEIMSASTLVGSIAMEA